MEHFKVNSLEELEVLIEGFGENVLFRGQINHYGELGKPSVLTSFERKGCIPTEMLKWSRYAKNVLDVFIGEHINDFNYHQALLQHYGWRSFFIDCSSNPAVGAWFASHIYSSDFVNDLSEDYEERPVLLRKEFAQYDFEEGEGHLYVLDKALAGEVGLVDLAALTIEGARPRTAAQAAWLIGPVYKGCVPQHCFSAQITASRSVLRDYAAARGLNDTDALFPPVTEDPILHALLGLPWREIEEVRNPTFNLPVFRRTLSLPEYQDSFVKIAWPRTAFFRGGKVADTFETIDGDPVGGIVISVPNTVLFGTAAETMPLSFPNIEALVEKFGTVAFEVDELIQHANMGHLTIYQKGIGVIPRGDGLFEVCELAVEHPGLDMTRAGFNQGRYYRKGENGLWVRERHPQECNCGDSNVHGQHISALHIAEDFIKNNNE